MPICEGCGSNYDDNFRFCPYCGRANSRVGPVPTPISREICHLDYRNEIVDKHYAEKWWEAVSNGNVVDRTPGYRFQFDNKHYKFYHFANRDDGFDLLPTKNDKRPYGEIEKKQYRELISRLMANGWEFVSDSQLKLMQRVKK